MLVLETPALALGIPIVAECRTARLDRPPQDSPDGISQRTGFLNAEGVPRPARMDAGEVQGLVGIDVPHAGHAGLIQQGGLDRLSRRCERTQEGVRADLERIGPERLPSGFEIARRRIRPKPAETSRIDKDEARPIIERPGRVPMKGRGSNGRPEHLHRAGHAETHDQHPARSGDDRDLFSTTHQPVNSFACKKIRRRSARHAGFGRAPRPPAGRIAGQRQHVSTMELRAHDTPTNKRRDKAATQGFNLGQLGHR
jgi:hypothetical protein